MFSNLRIYTKKTRYTFNNNLIISYIMAKRVTIMLDEDNDKKLRIMQAKLITKESKSISFSKVLNITLRKSLK